ncbi:sigma factor-like helix-turn-helix DNA-binding protein [Rhizobium calliandrae]|uniref:sigma factor-like helix-turn-helix DNA-binding protein n=1 Tax=Rhizobium calliandrae TaxID=1312182 RepID=UPI003D80A533
MTFTRIARLPLQQRSAVLLSNLEGLAYGQTNEILQTTIRDINHTLLAARLALFTHASTNL